MPLLILAALFANFFSWLLIGLEVFLWREWFLHKDLFGEVNENYAQRCLIGQ